MLGPECHQGSTADTWRENRRPRQEEGSATGHTPNGELGSSRGQHTLYSPAIMTNVFLFGRHTEDTSRQRLRIFMRLKKKKKRSIYDLAKLNEISLMAINIQEVCLKSLKKDSKKEETCQPILLLLRTQEPITTLSEY